VNAAKYGTGWVSLRLMRTVERAELTISNGGDVIPPQQLAQFFAPFARGDSAHAGAGLGLYVASEVARAHGGELTAESDSRSTRFVLRLPIRSSPPQ
jgi:sigma-B regulation protein RsbU (phosphoserine phosphatase)